jgi:hypothetical protein
MIIAKCLMMNEARKSENGSLFTPAFIRHRRRSDFLCQYDCCGTLSMVKKEELLSFLMGLIALLYFCGEFAIIQPVV